MLITKPRFETFAEYLQYDDNSEKFYELFNGELIEMPPESGFNFQSKTDLLGAVDYFPTLPLRLIYHHLI